MNTKTRVARLIVFAGLLFLNPSAVRSAGEFEIFDGRVYNGKFYPRIDIIEWRDKPTEQTRMEFHVYSKGKPVELSFELEKKDKKRVMLVHYHIVERDEHLCRRVLAPSHFDYGFKVYVDPSDEDFDNVLVSMEKLPEKKGRKELLVQRKYVACTASEEKKERLPAASDMPQPKGYTDQKRTKGDKGALKKDGVAVPFGDW